MTVFTTTIAEHLSAHDDVSIAAFPGATIAGALSIHEAVSFSYLAGASIADGLKIHEAITVSAKYTAFINDLIRIHPSVARAIVASIADGFHVHDAISTALAVFVAERLKLVDSVSSQGLFGLTIAEHLRIHDQVAKLLAGFLNDNLSVSESLVPVWMFSAAIAQNLSVHDTITPKLVISIQLGDTVDINDLVALQAILTATIIDGITMSVSFIDPGGGITTWAVNTRTSAITEYQNYAFNSFAQMGHHFLGATSSGLYVLDGTLDDTASVIARVKSGSAQFSGSRFTAIDAIYLGCRVSDGGKDWLLKLHAGDGRVYVYQFRPLNRRTTRIFTGKGLRARYFSWELITAGEDFDLDDIEFVPIGSHRRSG